MGFQDVVIIAAIVALIAYGGRFAAWFGGWLGEGLNNRRGGGPGGPRAT